MRDKEGGREEELKLYEERGWEQGEWVHDEGAKT